MYQADNCREYVCQSYLWQRFFVIIDYFDDCRQSFNCSIVYFDNCCQINSNSKRDIFITLLYIDVKFDEMATFNKYYTFTYIF